MMTETQALPADLKAALLVGRVWRRGDIHGPCVVVVRDGVVWDITAQAPTVADLLDRDDAAQWARTAPGVSLGPVAALLAPTDADTPLLLAPCDLQAIKACGVTFAVSLLERVIEEQAGGDASRAATLRAELLASIGADLSAIRPGSADAEKLKQALVARGAWSQYMEVGIGPTPKCSPRRSRCRPSATAPPSASTANRSGTIPRRKSCWPCTAARRSSAPRS